MSPYPRRSSHLGSGPETAPDVGAEPFTGEVLFQDKETFDGRAHLRPTGRWTQGTGTPPYLRFATSVPRASEFPVRDRSGRRLSDTETWRWLRETRSEKGGEGPLRGRFKEILDRGPRVGAFHTRSGAVGVDSWSRGRDRRPIHWPTRRTPLGAPPRERR